MKNDPVGLLALKRRYCEQIEGFRRLEGGNSDRLIEGVYHKDALWSGSHPFNSIHGSSEVHEKVWRPLLHAFPDLERRTDILIAGRFKGGDWVASTGHLVGLFSNDLFGIPATKRPAWLRYGAYERIEDGKVREAYWIFDIPGLMRQAGAWPLATSLGMEVLTPGPATRDGVELTLSNEQEAVASLKLVEALIAGLMQYDGKSLASMGMRRFWTPEFHWYGPSGIGAMRGHLDYERGHQRPFLKAFPDRVGGDHKCRIGEGAYVASAGWPSVRATHLGGGWLGLSPTGKRIGMRVMDVWRREGDMLVENWVLIDLIDLLAQMGVDVFQRMEELIGDRPQ